MQPRRALSAMALSLVFLVAALSPGCTDASPSNLVANDPANSRGGNTVASIEVSLDTTLAQVGQPIRASAVVKNSHGNVLSGKALHWSISDTSMASIDQGTITTKRPGNDFVRATVDNVTGQQQFTILAVQSATPGPVASVKVVLDSSSLTMPHTAQASATRCRLAATAPGQQHRSSHLTAGMWHL